MPLPPQTQVAQSAFLDQHPRNSCSPAVPLLTHAANLALKPCPAAVLCPLFRRLPMKGKPASAVRWEMHGAGTAAFGGVSGNLTNLTGLQGKEPIIWQLYAAHFSGRLVVKGNKIYTDISTRRFPLEATFTAVSWIFSETAWEDLFCVSIFLGSGADNGHT